MLQCLACLLRIEIVKPSDVSVLRADGGGVIAPDSNGSLLTMITCYPFYYVGSAPKRFVVQAKLISASTDPTAQIAGPKGFRWYTGVCASWEVV
ncbi:MAG: sortase [Acidobacteriaceae bacterium]|nr:sortase [Acidobacteriaceae bacterium]